MICVSDIHECPCKHPDDVVEGRTHCAAEGESELADCRIENLQLGTRHAKLIETHLLCFLGRNSSIMKVLGLT